MSHKESVKIVAFGESAPMVRPRLSHRTASFVAGDRPRFIFQARDTLEPSIAISLFEQFLAHKKTSYNSVKAELDRLNYLFGWAAHEHVNLEEMLLNGFVLSPGQVRSFAYWLSQFISYDSKDTGTIGVETYNKILTTSAVLFVWFVRQFGAFDGKGNAPHVAREKVVEFIKNQFKENKKKVRKLVFAGDMSEEEIASIERFLKPINRTDVGRDVAVRDYLIWRLAIEFGLRMGEILALRLADCPHGRQQHIKIVRIEERGLNYTDPRGTAMPRPKTLSRELGFILSDSPIPRLISDYVSEHRCRIVKKNGRKVKQAIIDHDFLLVAHVRQSGPPLSSSAMARVAENISKKTGVGFNWHLARHAFFNRAYLSIAHHPELKGRLMDLVYWGGWADEKSLQCYINRARRHRASMALIFWQQGENLWNALS